MITSNFFNKTKKNMRFCDGNKKFKKTAFLTFFATFSATFQQIECFKTIQTLQWPLRGRISETQTGAPHARALGEMNRWRWSCHLQNGNSSSHTVDGRNPTNQLRLVVYPIIYKVLAPSQVVVSGFLNHQRRIKAVNWLKMHIFF